MVSAPIHAVVTGLVIAGGLGRRMGGVDKGLQLLGDRPLVAWVNERLKPQVAHILINANRRQEEFARYGEQVISDRIGGFAGPLAGLHAGLTACSTELLVSVPCDTPFLPSDLVRRLYDGLERANAELAVARAGSRLQPLFAMMRRGVLENLSEFLSGGGRQASAWLESLDVAMVDFDDAEAFMNINTREELEKYSRRQFRSPTG